MSEHTPNARLRAAAPDLLDALLEMLAAYRIPLAPDLRRLACRKAEAAIAKATEETP